MNGRQKQVQRAFLDREDTVRQQVEAGFTRAARACAEAAQRLYAPVCLLSGVIERLPWGDAKRAGLEARRQAMVYGKASQEVMRMQFGEILGAAAQYALLSDYFRRCYGDGYLGTVYDLHGQGVTAVLSYDRQRMIEVVFLESRLPHGLYVRLEQIVSRMLQKLVGQASHCMAAGGSAQQCTKLLEGAVHSGYCDVMRIVRTEGHRIRSAAQLDAMMDARDKGFDIVKRWEAALDGASRSGHRLLDGQVRELEEAFSNGLQYPGDPHGGAGEVINCRCTLTAAVPPDSDATHPVRIR